MSNAVVLTVKGLGFGFWEGKLNGLTYRIEPTDQYSTKYRSAKYRAVIKRRSTILKEEHGFEVKDAALTWLRHQARLQELLVRQGG